MKGKTLALMAGALLFLGSGAVNAAGMTIYSDGFSGGSGTDLNRLAPDTRPGTETWTAHTIFKADGSAGGLANASAYLPFTPEAGKIYILSADVSVSAPTTTRWLGIGFGTSILGTTQAVNQNTRGVAALTLQVRGHLGAFRDGATLVTAAGTGYGTAQTLSMVLTTYADSTPWKVDYYAGEIGSTPFATYTWATGGNPGIARVAISSNGADLTGIVDNFSLTTATSKPDVTPMVLDAGAKDVSINAKGSPLRIMPLGDSITVGFTDNPKWTHPFEFGYRSGLQTRLKNAEYDFVFVGSSKEPFTKPERFGDPTHGGTVGPTLDLRALNQNGHHGHGGFGITGIQGFAARWISEQKPDIILLLIGINGMSAESPQQLDSLVQTIYDTDKGVALIVAQITPSSRYNRNLFDYNTFIRETLVPKYAAEGYTISTVDQYKHFLADPEDPQSIDAARLSNGRNHPANPLYDQMAESWFEGIGQLLKQGLPGDDLRSHPCRGNGDPGRRQPLKSE